MKQAKAYLAANNVTLPPIPHPTLFVCVSYHAKICQCDGRFDLFAPVLSHRIRYLYCDTQQRLVSVILGCVEVTQ